MRWPLILVGLVTCADSTAVVPVTDAQAPADASSPGSGFWDPGFEAGTWRTDFDDPSAGLAGHPLTLQDCAFSLATDTSILNGAGPTYWNENTSMQVACDRTSTTYASSNASSSSATWPTDAFWVITANNERSFGPEGTCSDTGPNTGPPNQSKPVGKPGQGVFGVDVSGGKATLAMDTSQFPNCVSPTDKVKIPFLSLGAQTERGQGRPITYLNDDRYPKTLKFKATLEDIAPAGVASSTGKARANFGYVFVEVKWGSIRRWAYVDLFSRSTGAPPFVREDWNWNVEESMWYPGAEIVFVGADELASTCPGIVAALMPPVAGSSFDYSIDLNVLFRCLSSAPGKTWSSPMPPTPLAVTGVHWAIEMAIGTNWTRMSIENVALAR
jgi:hypothetical protein